VPIVTSFSAPAEKFGAVAGEFTQCTSTGHTGSTGAEIEHLSGARAEFPQNPVLRHDIDETDSFDETATKTRDCEPLRLAWPSWMLDLFFAKPKAPTLSVDLPAGGGVPPTKQEQLKVPQPQPTPTKQEQLREQPFLMALQHFVPSAGVGK
jgi:hypothetical protein